MTLQEIHDMSADALAGEELQYKTAHGEEWRTDHKDYAFHHGYRWRIKPTIEVNGVMLTKRQAKAAWGLSGATSYEYTDMKTYWNNGAQSTPEFAVGKYYRWQEPKWIYVNGEKIVRSGGTVSCYGAYVANDTDGEKLKAAIHKLIEIK